ncbi:MAG: hypothetical protein ACKVOE_09615 [Rickettsiales bacterium]
MSNDEKDGPKPANPWIDRLAKPERPLQTPVDRLAKHLLPGDGTMWPMKCLDGEEAGSLHFSVPAEWLSVARENHDFRVPTSLHHTHGGAEPFSREVEGGQALGMWLGDQAWPKHLAQAEARALLNRRAVALSESLQDIFGIVPLEARLYFPPEKLAAALQDQGHAVSAAMFLATDAAYQELLRTKVQEHLLTRRDVEQIKAAHASTLPQPTLSAKAVEEMLAEHGDTFADVDDEEKRQVFVQYTSTCVADIAANLVVPPMVVARSANGIYSLPFTDDDGETKYVPCDAGGLGLSDNPSHVLVLRLSDDFPVSPHPAETSLEPDKLSNVHEHDGSVVRGLGMGLRAQLGNGWSASYLFRTELGNLIVLSTDAPNPQETLTEAEDFIEQTRDYYFEQGDNWQNYLRAREIDTPPHSKG